MYNLLAFGLFGGYEWFLVLLIVLLLFGGSQIPKLARSLGSGIAEFKQGVNETKENLDTPDPDSLLSDETTTSGKKETSTQEPKTTS